MTKRIQCPRCGGEDIECTGVPYSPEWEDDRRMWTREEYICHGCSLMFTVEPTYTMSSYRVLYCDDREVPIPKEDIVLEAER